MAAAEQTPGQRVRSSVARLLLASLTVRPAAADKPRRPVLPPIGPALLPPLAFRRDPLAASTP
jgi:hypothetical protein